MKVRALIFSVATFAAFAPSVAEADCTSATECLCTDADNAADVRVTAMEEARSTVQVEAVEGVSSRYAVGESFPLPRHAEDAVGRRLLVFFKQEDVRLIVPVDEGGQFTCERAEPVFALSAREAMEAGTSGICSEILWRKGLQEPPCNDAGLGCTGAPAGAAILVPALLVFLRRRRRRCDCGSGGIGTSAGRRK